MSSRAGNGSTTRSWKALICIRITFSTTGYGIRAVKCTSFTFMESRAGTCIGARAGPMSFSPCTPDTNRTNRTATITTTGGTGGRSTMSIIIPVTVTIPNTPDMMMIMARRMMGVAAAAPEARADTARARGRAVLRGRLSNTALLLAVRERRFWRMLTETGVVFARRPLYGARKAHNDRPCASGRRGRWIRLRTSRAASNWMRAPLVGPSVLPIFENPEAGLHAVGAQSTPPVHVHRVKHPSGPGVPLPLVPPGPVSMSVAGLHRAILYK